MWACSASKWPKLLINRVTNYLLTGMAFEVVWGCLSTTFPEPRGGLVCRNDYLLPVIPWFSQKMSVSPLVATFQILRHFPLNHDFWRRSRTSRRQGRTKKTWTDQIYLPPNKQFAPFAPENLCLEDNTFPFGQQKNGFFSRAVLVQFSNLQDDKLLFTRHPKRVVKRSIPRPSHMASRSFVAVFAIQLFLGGFRYHLLKFF